MLHARRARETMPVFNYWISLFLDYISVVSEVTWKHTHKHRFSWLHQYEGPLHSGGTEHKKRDSNKIPWPAGCWHEAASPPSRWARCSWQRGSFPEPSPWPLSWPSPPRCAWGCWASLGPRRTPPARRNRTGGKRWARRRWPWRRTLWAAPKPARCTRRTARAPRGCLSREGGRVNLAASKGDPECV